MNFSQLQDALRANLNLSNIVMKGAYLICLALAFELMAWWFNRFIEKQVSPLITGDANREAGWRMRRRTILRQTPKAFSRSIIYVVAILLVFNLFGVPLLPLSIAVGAVIALFAAGLIPIFRDLTQGYAMLAEDTLAVGDQVEIDGHVGTVERFTLRSTVLRDREGRAHILSNRDIQNVIVVKRREEATKKN